MEDGRRIGSRKNSCHTRWVRCRSWRRVPLSDDRSWSSWPRSWDYWLFLGLMPVPCLCQGLLCQGLPGSATSSRFERPRTSRRSERECRAPLWSPMFSIQCSTASSSISHPHRRSSYVVILGCCASKQTEWWLPPMSLRRGASIGSTSAHFRSIHPLSTFPHGVKGSMSTSSTPVSTERTPNSRDAFNLVSTW